MMESNRQGHGMATWVAVLPKVAAVLLLIATALPASGQVSPSTADLPGDANNDRVVNLDDFALLKVNFGTTEGATRAMGDFDGDGDVDLDDFVVLKTNFGRTTYITLDLGDGVSMTVVYIPAGTFLMGSPDTEQDRYAWEGPQHQVTLTKPYYMGVYEVTQRQYLAVTGTNPSFFTEYGLDAPVDRVTWDDAMAFCEAVSQRTGRTVTLPTEAQWEYACRAGSTTRFYYGDDPDYALLGNYAWYYDNSDRHPHPVGEKLPNAWGLYDMHQNVIEWCTDWYDMYTPGPVVDPQGPATGDSRVWRSSSWYYEANHGRSAYRSALGPDGICADIGFRVVVLDGGSD